LFVSLRHLGVVVGVDGLAVEVVAIRLGLSLRTTCDDPVSLAPPAVRVAASRWRTTRGRTLFERSDRSRTAKTMRFDTRMKV